MDYVFALFLMTLPKLNPCSYGMLCRQIMGSPNIEETAYCWLTSAKPNNSVKQNYRRKWL